MTILWTLQASSMSSEAYGDGVYFIVYQAAGIRGARAGKSTCKSEKWDREKRLVNEKRKAPLCAYTWVSQGAARGYNWERGWMKRHNNGEGQERRDLQNKDGKATWAASNFRQRTAWGLSDSVPQIKHTMKGLSGSKSRADFHIFSLHFPYRMNCLCCPAGILGSLQWQKGLGPVPMVSLDWSSQCKGLSITTMHEPQIL